MCQRNGRVASSLLPSTSTLPKQSVCSALPSCSSASGTPLGSRRLNSRCLVGQAYILFPVSRLRKVVSSKESFRLSCRANFGKQHSAIPQTVADRAPGLDRQSDSEVAKTSGNAHPALVREPPRWAPEAPASARRSHRHYIGLRAGLKRVKSCCVFLRRRT